MWDVGCVTHLCVRVMCDAQRVMSDVWMCGPMGVWVWGWVVARICGCVVRDVWMCGCVMCVMVDG